jgi:hypothetical protein
MVTYILEVGTNDSIQIKMKKKKKWKALMILQMN